VLVFTSLGDPRRRGGGSIADDPPFLVRQPRERRAAGKQGLDLREERDVAGEDPGTVEIGDGPHPGLSALVLVASGGEITWNRSERSHQVERELRDGRPDRQALEV